MEDGYRPTGQCIYCGWDGGGEGLRGEHIVPYSLGGDFELQNASCRRCEGATSYVDGYVANQIFGHFRVHSNIQSRSGHKEELPILMERDQAERLVNLPTRDHPFFLNMPVWGLPAMFTGGNLFDDFPPGDKHVFWSVPKTLRETLRLKDGELVKFTDVLPPLNIPVFARQLMKIAYCNGVRSHGLHGFRPLFSPEIVIGRFHHIAYFVGSEPGLPPPPERQFGGGHRVDDMTMAFGSKTLLVARIRLFAGAGFKETGMPIYQVVYGIRGTRKAIPSRPLPKRHHKILL